MFLDSEEGTGYRNDYRCGCLSIVEGPIESAMPEATDRAEPLWLTMARLTRRRAERERLAV